MNSRADVPAPLFWGDYREVLDAAWEDARREREPGAPTVVSLFAGCGGSSLGYAMAGYDERMAVEWDTHACEVLRLNFPELYVWQGDVSRLSDDDALALAGELEPGDLDVLDGSPPCQGFSMSGRRVLEDDRNVLFREYVRLLRAFRPKALVMENVRGMVQGKMRLIFAEILKALRDEGYRVSARVLDSRYFWVPQARQRVIFVGVRNDLGVDPAHPLPESSAVPAKVALRGIPEERQNEKEGWPGPLHEACERDWHKIPPGKNQSYLTPGSGFNNLSKLDPERPCPTIIKIWAPSGRFASMVHWAEPRCLTAAEAQRLASFPDGFRFVGKYKDRMARIGNCVPPLMMRAVAAQVRGLLEEAKERGEAGKQ